MKTTTRFRATMMLLVLLTASAVGTDAAPVPEEVSENDTYRRVERFTDRVDAESSNFYEITVYAGETVRLVVDGDGDTDLDLYVDDGYTIVAYDNDPTDYCITEWYADVWYTSQTRTFYVEVENLGDVYNEFELILTRTR